MQQRNKRQIISNIVFALPEQLGLMRHWIADYRKATFQQRSETFVPRTFRLGLQSVEGKNWAFN